MEVGRGSSRKRREEARSNLKAKNENRLSAREADGSEAKRGRREKKKRCGRLFGSAAVVVGGSSVVVVVVVVVVKLRGKKVK